MGWFAGAFGAVGMTALNLNPGAGRPSEIRVGLRSGWVRSVAISVGSAGILGLAAGVIGLAQRHPDQVLDLLSRWGFVWLLVLAAMILVWDLVKGGIDYLGRLSEGVHETAVAMNRIADRDDRERQQMITETAFVGRRIERLGAQHEEWKAEQREHNAKLEEMLRSVLERKGGD